METAVNIATCTSTKAGQLALSTIVHEVNVAIRKNCLQGYQRKNQCSVREANTLGAPKKSRKRPQLGIEDLKDLHCGPGIH